VIFFIIPQMCIFFGLMNTYRINRYYRQKTIKKGLVTIMKRKPSLRVDTQKKDMGGLSILLAAVKAQVAVAASGLILLLIFCAIANATQDPDSIIQPLSLCALFLSAFFGGIFAVRLSGDGLLSGALSGCVTVLLVLLFSLLPLPSFDGMGTPKIISLLCIIGSSVAGTLIGKKRTKSTPHSRHRKRI